MVKILCLVLLLGLLPAPADGAETLWARIAALAAPLKLTVGVGLLSVEDGRELSYHGDQRFPLQSVVKFPLALLVLREVDQGRLNLDQEVVIGPGQMTPNTWSPLREKYPRGAKLPLAEVLRYTVSLSDNVGCDVLLGLVGGPAKVEDFIHGLGILDMAIRYGEARLQRDWQAQFANWSTPLATARLLRLFYQGKVLKPPSTAFLLEVMYGTTTGAQRLKGGLPPGTPLAHKTGTSGVRQGVRAAVNDVGLITLPNGGQLALAVLVTDSREDLAACEGLIAAIARAAYEHFAGTGKPNPAN